MAALGPLINLMLNTGLAAVIVVGAWRVSTGAMKPGAIVAFLTYFTIILNSVMAISRLITMVLQGHCQRRPCGGGHDDAPGHGDPPLDRPS